MFIKVIEVLLHTPKALVDTREELEQFIVEKLEISKDINIKIVDKLSKDTKIVISLVSSVLGECDKTYYQKYQNREFRFLFYYFQDAEIGIDDFSDEVFERVEFKSEVERDTKLYSSFDGVDEVKRSLEVNLKEAISDLIRKTNYSKINARVINRSKGEKFYNNDNNMRKVDNFLRREKRISLINGLGGVGKTTLAIEYATDALREGIYDYAIWFDVENGIESEIKKFAIGYLLDDSEDGKKDSSYYERKFVDFLNDNPNSLVILDNLEYRDPYKKELENFLNKHKRIDIIITSRQHITKLDIHPIELDVFKSEHDGLEMFKLNSTRTYSHSEEQILKEIIKHLGNLPLALEITANFLSEFEEMKVSDYLNELKKNGLKLFGRIEEYNHLKSLQATLTINSSITNNENALKLLKIFSLISPEPIEKEIIDKYLMEVLEVSGFEKAIVLRDLEKFSYIKVSDDGYSMHRLLQEAIVEEFFDGKNDEEQIDLTINISLAILRWFNDSFNNYKYGSYFSKTVYQIKFLLKRWININIDEAKIYLYTCLSAYEGNIGKNVKDVLIDIEKAIELLNKINIKNRDKAIIYITYGKFLRLNKQYIKSETFYNDSLELIENERMRAIVYHHKALLYSDQREYIQAKKLYEESLEILNKIYGKNHIHLTNTMVNLATVYSKIKEYNSAEILYEKSLEIKIKELGNNHPDTATTYANLGMFYQNTKQYIKSFNYYYLSLVSRLNLELLSENKFLINNYFYSITKSRNMLGRIEKSQRININKKIEELNTLSKQKGFKKIKLKKLK